MDTVTVVSLAPYPTRSKTREEHPAPIVVPVKPEDEPYGKMTIKSGYGRKDFGDGNFMPLEVKARAIATDIVRGLEEHGVFVAEGEEPTKEELAAARAKRKAFNIRQVDDADSVWARTGDRKRIPWHAFFAVKELGLRREWATDVASMVTCPACNELISKDTAKCSKCQAILNPQKAADFGALTAEQLQYFKERGMVATLKKAEKKD